MAKPTTHEWCDEAHRPGACPWPYRTTVELEGARHADHSSRPKHPSADQTEAARAARYAAAKQAALDERAARESAAA
jgi:hypothetical protein